MEQNTHHEINKELCGIPVEIKNDYCLVRLDTNTTMQADSSGLIHGGFIFGAADYAAMVAVNHPHVVLGSADVKFLKPVKVRDTVYAEARVVDKKDNKRIVSVTARVEKENDIFKGTFTCFVLEKHVLSA